MVTIWDTFRRAPGLVLVLLVETHFYSSLLNTDMKPRSPLGELNNIKGRKNI